MAEKTKKREKTDTIGIFNAIDKEETSFFEKHDNSWWWTFALFLFLICVTAIWAYTTFGYNILE